MSFHAAIYPCTACPSPALVLPRVILCAVPGERVGEATIDDMPLCLECAAGLTLGDVTSVSFWLAVARGWPSCNVSPPTLQASRLEWLPLEQTDPAEVRR